MKNKNPKNNCRRAILVLFLAMAVVVLPASGVLAGNAGIPGQAGELEGPQFDMSPRVTVKIEKKMLEQIITNAGKKYSIAKETIIMGLDGRQVGIRQMKVPCEAEITYETKNGARFAQQIKMIRVGQNSSWHWDTDKPE